MLSFYTLISLFLSVTSKRLRITENDELIAQVNAQLFKTGGTPTMATIPVHRDDSHSFEPRTTIQTRYAQSKASDLVTADFVFNTNRLVIHLDNVKVIREISCTNTTIDLSFANDMVAHMAIDEWSKHSNLVVLLGWERKCNHANEVSTFAVKTISIQEKVVTLKDLTALTRRDIVTTWKLDISQFGISTNTSIDPSELSKYQKRAYTDLVEDVKEDFQRLAVEPIRSLGKNIVDSVTWRKNSSSHYDLTSNYNNETKSVINSDLEIYNFLQAVANCIDCYTLGKADVQIQIEGMLADVKKYKVTVNGDLKVNVDLRVIMRSFSEMPLKTIFNIPLLPFDIPGVFAFGPAFRVGVGISAGAISELKVDMGFDFFIPMVSFINLRTLKLMLLMECIHLLKSAA
jgi:hypothetical protein